MSQPYTPFQAHDDSQPTVCSYCVIKRIVVGNLNPSFEATDIFASTVFSTSARSQATNEDLQVVIADLHKQLRAAKEERGAANEDMHAANEDLHAVIADLREQLRACNSQPANDSLAANEDLHALIADLHAQLRAAKEEGEEGGETLRLAAAQVP